MPQWTVEGAEKTTGKDTTLLVEAPDAVRAREVATGQGLLVADVKPSDEHATVAAPPLAYRTAGSPTPAPSFGPLRNAARVLRALALVQYAIAASMLGTALLQFRVYPRIEALIQTAAYAGLIATVGAICQTGAALLLAHRESLTHRG